jgi:hypothetical protein
MRGAWFRNRTGVDHHPLTLNWPAGVILVHPAKNTPLTVGWKSPVTDIVGVTDKVAEGRNGIDWSIARNDTPLAGGGSPNGRMHNSADGVVGSSLARVSLTAGDFPHLGWGPSSWATAMTPPNSITPAG